MSLEDYPSPWNFFFKHISKYFDWFISVISNFYLKSEVYRVPFKTFLPIWAYYIINSGTRSL
jgi:hypothetical protein